MAALGGSRRERVRARCFWSILTRWVFVWLAGSCMAMAQAAPDGASTRILVVYSDTSRLTANLQISEGLSDVLEDQLFPRLEIYTEFRAIQQFPEEEHDRSFIDMLAGKYSGKPLDAVVAVGPTALEVVLAHRSEFAPGTPVVAGGITVRSLGDELPPDVHAAVSYFDISETVSLAKRMQPDATRLVVFTGSSEFDRNWERTARTELEDEDTLSVEYVSDLTLAEFEAAAAELGPATILLILTIFEDASGTGYIPAEAAGLISARSTAPSWGVYNTFVENGVVGGVVESFEEVGRTVGRLTLDAIAGRLEGSTSKEVPHASVLDWGEMRRFGLDPSLRPPDAFLLNYTPTLWERYWKAILGVLAVVLAQTATIAALMAQGRRRQAAQQEAAEHRLELARMSRISQIGALSGAITHELNQPLTAILANAETAVRHLRDPEPDLAEVREILGDIANDDRRAAKIISDLRSLMNRGTINPQPMDLNDVAKAAVSLVQSEALLRGVRISTDFTLRPLVVLGESEQLGQVVLNLVLNGVDAMADQSTSTSLLTVKTTERPDGWRVLEVQDTGPGLADTIAEDPFAPFATTKDHGTGMGLAICRTIVAAHHGSISFEPCETGARAVVALPPQPRA